MGLPEIDIIFKGKAVSAIQRSERGVVALIVKDDVQEADTVEYRDISEVEAEDWSPEVYDYIEKTLRGTPNKLIVERLDTEAEGYNEALSRLKNKRFNYLAIPQIEESETSVVASWIKSQRENNKKTFKAVLPHADEDHEGIINFTTRNIKVGDREYTTAEYTARIAGILSSLPFTRSATYFQLNEVDSIEEIENPDEAIDNGELILINDGENIKIGRGVNSLTTTTTEKTEDWKSIRVVEVMDLIQDDIRTTFSDEYVGKVNNTYDNQVLFFRSVNAYFAGLAGDEILDPNFDNYAELDTEAQRLAWEEIGTDTSDWDEQKVKEMSFRTNVFAKANIKIVNTMEDLTFEIAV